MYDQNKGVVINVDFQKIFDKFLDQRFLAKLVSHCIDGVVLRWQGKSLTGRKRRVVINGQASEWLEVASGMLQGSVLRPILFVI